MPVATNKRFVIAKQGKFATVGGGLGSAPKVYDTVTQAQHDIDYNPKFRGAVVQPYEGDKVAATVPGVSTTVKTATTSKIKAKAAKGTKTTAPKRAAAGK